MIPGRPRPQSKVDGQADRELRSPSRTYFSHKRLRSVPSGLQDIAVLVEEVRPRSRLSGTKGPNLPVLLDLLSSLISLTQSPNVWLVSVGWRGELAQAGRVHQRLAAVTHRPRPKGTTVTDLRNRPAHSDRRPSAVPVFREKPSGCSVDCPTAVILFSPRSVP